MVLVSLDPRGAHGFLGFLLSVTWIFLLLRMYVRIAMVRKVGLDDYLVIASTLFYTAFIVFAYGLISNGLGTDIDDDDSQKGLDLFSKGSFYFMLSELAFIISSTILRLACAVMLWRVVLRKDALIRHIIWITALVTALYSTAFFFVTLFQCWPISEFWTHMYRPDQPAQCIGGATMTSEAGGYFIMTTLFMIHSILSFVCDWILGSLPFFMLRHLQMSTKKKTVIILLMSLGILVGVTALVRIPLLAHANKIEFWDEAIPVAITAALEPFLGTVALCSAAIMPLFKKAALRRINSDDMVNPSGSGSGGSHALTSRTKKPSDQHNGHSKTAIVVETSWIVEDDADDRSRKSDSSPNHEAIAVARAV